MAQATKFDHTDNWTLSITRREHIFLICLIHKGVIWYLNHRFIEFDKAHKYVYKIGTNISRVDLNNWTQKLSDVVSVKEPVPPKDERSVTRTISQSRAKKAAAQAVLDAMPTTKAQHYEKPRGKRAPKRSLASKGRSQAA